MNYVEQCLSDHIKAMRNRLASKIREKQKLEAVCEVLETEIDDLELGLKNWTEEARENQ